MRILVVGDLMLDHYVMGIVNRRSPEADVPVLLKECESFSLGGAGNTAANLANMGAEVLLVALGGADAAKCAFINLLLKEAHIQPHLVRMGVLSTKTRFIVEGHNQLLRLDEEQDQRIKVTLPTDFDPDVIVVADYAKGVIQKDLMDTVRGFGVPVIVDPKPIHTPLYNGVYAICPNKKEWKEMALPPRGCEYVVETQGSEGITVWGKHLQVVHFQKMCHVSSHPVDVVDVCGAGDTVTAVVAMCTAMGKSITKSAVTALNCAEWVITQPGTVPVTKEVFERYLV